MPLQYGRLTPQFIPLSPETLALLKHGAQYHGITVKIYARWLLDLALQDEAHYYGWPVEEIVATRSEPADPPGANDAPEAVSDD